MRLRLATAKSSNLSIFVYKLSSTESPARCWNDTLNLATVSSSVGFMYRSNAFVTWQFGSINAWNISTPSVITTLFRIPDAVRCETSNIRGQNSFNALYLRSSADS